MALTKRKSDQVNADEVKIAAVKPLYDPAQIDYPHGGWIPEVTQLKHSLPAYLLCTSVILSLAIFVSDYFDPIVANRENIAHQDYSYPIIGYSIFGYYCFLLVSRWIESDSHVLYEQVWACNMAMLWSVTGMLTNRPLMTGMACAIVCIDQFMWYVDIAFALCTGFKKFPIGVARYLVWPTTSFMKRVTAGHHLWFLPVMLYSLHWDLPRYSFIAGALIMGSSLVAISRFTTPFHCLLPIAPTAGDKKTEDQYKYRVLYLNINTSYAFWKDVKFSFLHVVDHKSPLLMIPFVVVFGNLTFNLAAYGIILQIISLIKMAF